MGVPFDTSTPNIARIYDYWLGGKDNFEADRRAADAIRAVRPNVAERALDNKRFLTRAVRSVASQGVRQFLDVGSGLPTSPAADSGAAADGAPTWLATHEAAGAEVPDPMVAYVDNDPVAVLHSRELLAKGRAGIVAVEADMLDPGAILAHQEIQAAGFDLGEPACVILACVLHFVPAATARDIMAAFTGALAPGSYLIVSVGYASGEVGEQFARAYNAQQGARIYAHSWDEITGFFAGLEVLPPGLADAAFWPLRAPTERSNMIVGAVARKD